MEDVKPTTRQKFRWDLFMVTCWTIYTTVNTNWSIQNQETLIKLNKCLEQSVENANKEYERSKLAWQERLDEERDSKQSLKIENDNLKQEIQILKNQW